MFSHHLPPAASLTGHVGGCGVGLEDGRSECWDTCWRPQNTSAFSTVWSKLQRPSGQDSYSSPRAFIFQWGSIQGWGVCVSIKFMFGEKRPFFVRYLNLYKNVRKWGVYIKFDCMRQRKSRLLLLKLRVGSLVSVSTVLFLVVSSAADLWNETSDKLEGWGRDSTGR